MEKEFSSSMARSAEERQQNSELRATFHAAVKNIRSLLKQIQGEKLSSIDDATLRKELTRARSELRSVHAQLKGAWAKEEMLAACRAYGVQADELDRYIHGGQ